MKKLILTFLCVFVFTSVSCLFESQAVPVNLQNKEKDGKKTEESLPEDLKSGEEDGKDEEKDEEKEEEKDNTGTEEENSEKDTEKSEEKKEENSEEENNGEETQQKTEEEKSEENPVVPPDEKSEDDKKDDNPEEIIDNKKTDENPEENTDGKNPENDSEKESEEQKAGDNTEEDNEGEKTGDDSGKESEEEKEGEKSEQNTETEEPEEETPVHREWTFMVYMGADNSLEPYAIQDLNEMEAGIQKGGSVTVLSLLDRIPGYDDSNENWTGTRLYEVKNDEKGKNTGIVSKRIACPDLGINSETDTELNLARGNTLSFFVDFVKKEYESDHYCLIIWGNGGGWRGCVSDDSSSFTMSLPELGKSLEGKGLDAVVFDTSFGLTIETLYELKNACKFVAGTPGVNSESGIDYEKFFSEFCAGSKSTGSFLDKICSVSDSDFYAVSLANIQGVVDALNETGKALSGYITSRNIQKKVFENLLTNGKTSCSGNYPCDLYISLPACIEYFQTLNNTDVINASRSLQSALQKLSVSGDPVSPSVFLIPVISRGTAVSRHPESYVCPDGKSSDGIVRCSFVKNGNYWVPTGKNISFMDSLFYRSF